MHWIVSLEINQLHWNSFPVTSAVASASSIRDAAKQSGIKNR
jgi:hypothetical protein